MKVLVTIVVGLWLAFPVAAREVSGQRFEERIEAGTKTLTLCNASLLEWKGFLDVYVMALYLDDCGRLPGRPTAGARRLEIAYKRGFDGPQFADAAEKILKRSFDEAALAPLRARIDTLHAAYRRVEPGDRYTLTYVPDVGTELAWNGTALVTVPGADFADAYFDIWLGPKPADEDLRDRLLAPSER